MPTIDERLQFLLQSTESLHASTQELHATAARHDKQIDRISEQLDKLIAARRSTPKTYSASPTSPEHIKIRSKTSDSV